MKKQMKIIDGQKCVLVTADVPDGVGGKKTIKKYVPLATIEALKCKQPAVSVGYDVVKEKK